MKKTIGLALVMLLFLIPSTLAVEGGDAVAKGDIVAGAPTTMLFGSTVTSFYAEIEGLDGAVVYTSTEAHSGLRYDIDLYFYDEDRLYLGGCASAAADETGCTVPAGAALMVVSAFYGADLTVTVLLDCTVMFCIL